MFIKFPVIKCLLLAQNHRPQKALKLCCMFTSLQIWIRFSDKGNLRFIIL